MAIDEMTATAHAIASLELSDSPEARQFALEALWKGPTAFVVNEGGIGRLWLLDPVTGEHDPVTPPAYAEHVIRGGLENSRHIVGRARGHGISAVGCMPRLLRRFVETADPAALDASCLSREPPMPFFLSFQGPAP